MPKLMPKKTLIFYFFLIFSAVLPLAVFAADVNLNFLTNETSNPGEFVANLYKFALGLSGAAAFGVIIYGAILYASSAGNPSKQKDAWDWIRGAIWGVVLLLAAYLILYTINPNLVDLTSPELNEINIVPFESSNSAGLTESNARSQLSQQSIGTKSACNPGQTKDCVKLEGMRQDTVDEIFNIAGEVGSSNIFVTAGTEAGHSDGPTSHMQGYKFDLRLNTVLSSYITDHFEHIGKRSDGVEQYKSSTGAIYALESDHWDVLVQ
jgi:hypothetical protein